MIKVGLKKIIGRAREYLDFPVNRRIV